MFKGMYPLDYGISSNSDIQAAMRKAAPPRLPRQQARGLPLPLERVLFVIFPARDRGWSYWEGRTPAELFRDRFSAGYTGIFIGSAGNVPQARLASAAVAVWLFDITAPRLPAFVAEVYPDAKRPDLSSGIYRYEVDGAIAYLSPPGVSLIS